MQRKAWWERPHSLLEKRDGAAERQGVAAGNRSEWNEGELLVRCGYLEITFVLPNQTMNRRLDS